MCSTRGEHATQPRAAQKSRPAAYLLSLRKRGVITEVLLQRRPDDATLMAGMYELPPLPQDVVHGREPTIRLRHAITNTNYYVQVFAPRGSKDQALRRAVPAARADLKWVRASRLNQLALTGLARKILQRLEIMSITPIRLAEEEQPAHDAKRQKRLKGKLKSARS
ncbi:hypothetical protein [Edaphobacter sp.]|uniref:hypothetical protein n=1 Tax=Edaphobacter sp. TaxID=1934404 RepID=UPI00345BCA84